MNITGYKRSKRGMRQMLNSELSKKDRCVPKIDRLARCIDRCSSKIRDLQAIAQAKRKKSRGK